MDFKRPSGLYQAKQRVWVHLTQGRAWLFLVLWFADIPMFLPNAADDTLPSDSSTTLTVIAIGRTWNLMEHTRGPNYTVSKARLCDPRAKTTKLKVIGATGRVRNLLGRALPWAQLLGSGASLLRTAASSWVRTKELSW